MIKTRRERRLEEEVEVLRETLAELMKATFGKDGPLVIQATENMVRIRRAKK